MLMVRTVGCKSGQDSRTFISCKILPEGNPLGFGFGLFFLRTPSSFILPLQRFTQLYRELDATTRTNDKVAALVDYFARRTGRRGVGARAAHGQQDSADGQLPAVAHVAG